MKRKIPRLAHLFVALSFIVPAYLLKGPAMGSQGRSQPNFATPGFDDFMEVQFAKTTVPGELLLRVLQFDAPFPGRFQELMVYRDGLAVTFRHVPNWAIQNTQSGMLKTNGLAEVQRRLTTLDLNGYSDSAAPEPGRLHTVLIYFDGRAYQRRNINGPLPASVQGPIETIQAAIRAEADSPAAFQKFRAASDISMKEAQILREGYRWTVLKEVQHRLLANVRCVLLTVRGVRGDAAMSIYHALVFYPDGKSYKPIDPGNWPGNPRPRVTMRFEHPNDPEGIGIKTVTHELVIEYRLIEDTLNLGNQSFPLKEGNLFVIQFDSNWTPLVRAVPAHAYGPWEAPAILEVFKAQLPTESVIQSLSLGR